MNNNLPSVDIIFPVRNREIYLPHFLKCIIELEYPKHLISIITYINDSYDKTESILNNFKKSYQKEYNNIYIKKYNLDTPDYSKRNGLEIVNIPLGNNTYKTVTRTNNEAIYKKLSKLRNLLLYKTTSDYIFSVDTDIMFPPNILQKLLDHNKHFVSALICNGYIYVDSFKNHNLDPHLFTNVMIKDETGFYYHVANYENVGLIEVDLTGAISLMSNQLVKSGVQYYNISKQGKKEIINFGEDAGFCESAQLKGFNIYCDTNIKCTHCMTEQYLDQYVQGNFIF